MLRPTARPRLPAVLACLLLGAGLAADVPARAQSGARADTPAGPAALPAYRIVDGAIPEPLTDRPGNPARGLVIVRDITKATCLICHAMPIPAEPDHGEIGPPLHGVGSRYTAGELRLRLVDPKALNPDSIMPSYYRVDDLYRVLGAYRGRPIYTAQEVEDVVAYLMTLRGE